MIMQTKKILVPILFLLISFVSVSQERPTPPTPPLPVPPPVGLPIDGGVLLAACFAVVYGARKLLFKK